MEELHLRQSRLTHQGETAMGGGGGGSSNDVGDVVVVLPPR